MPLKLSIVLFFLNTPFFVGLAKGVGRLSARVGLHDNVLDRTSAEAAPVGCQSVQFSSIQCGIYALGKAHTRSTPSLRSFPNVALVN